MKQSILNMKVSEIMELYKTDKLDISFDIGEDMVVGRKDLWNTPTKSMYIHSILSGYLLMPLVLTKKIGFLDEEINEYSVLDGKQRLMALIKYINNEYCLYELTPPIKSVQVKKLGFSQLSSKMQSKILDTEITIYENEGSFEENIDLYIRYNDGIPPKPIELFRTKIGLHSQLLNDISNHRLFKIINLNGRKRFQDYELALYLLMLETNHKTGLSRKEKELFVDKLSKTRIVNSKIIDRIKKKLDFLYETFNTPKYRELQWEDKYLKKSHIISMYLLLDKAISKDISSKQFFTWADKFFFTSKDVNNIYWIEVSRGSTTSRNSMDIRNSYLNEDFKEFLTGVEQENNKVVNLFTKRYS